MNALNPFTKKKQKQIDKNSKKLEKYKFLILKYLDPIQTHRFYGDFIIPDKLWQFSNSGIYRFKLEQDHKVIRQLHVRTNGIVLEFEDYLENNISPRELIQNRLASLGDKTAYEFSQFLTIYEQMFISIKNDETNLKKEEPTEQTFKEEAKKKKKNEIGQSFDWIDKTFENNQENVVFIRGSKVLGGKDYRTKFLAFNNKLLEWLTAEVNVFNNDFIDACLKIFKYKNFEDFANSFKCVMLKKPFPRYMHTLIGEILIPVNPQMYFLESDQIVFHVVVHEKENFDPIFLQKLKEKKEIKKLRITENDRIMSTNYGDLIKMYYMNR